MNLVNGISFIGALLVALHTTNCLFSVKPTYKVDKLESDIKPKAEIWTPQGFTQNRGDVDVFFKILRTNVETIRYKETDVNKVQVYTYEKYEQSNEILGLIGIVNACILIPCRFSNEYSLTLQYVVDSDIKKEEEYKENKTLWVWLPLVFYNLFTSNSDRNEFLNSGFRRILTEVGPNIANSVTHLEKENKGLLKEKYSKENAEWEKVNKNSLEAIGKYIASTPDGEFKKKAQDYREEFMNKKVQKYLGSNYPFVKPYLLNKLLYASGENAGFNQFYQIFRRLILEKNSETGFKQEVKLYQKDGKVVWEVELEDEVNLLYFVPHKDNITLEKISRKLNNFEFPLNYAEKGFWRANHLYNNFCQFPQENHIDIDFIQKIK
ncbi:hypothetical protein [Leptospira santarosai]|uniref:hypothetical protein n=1 Tax=Leptospira santarosai TaxID=28183 RepID=UPI0002BD3DAE|nr:hypothetical protein [Leptospira santarosai]EMO70740.1 hypothetical protein LEP1GSC130_0120 [Leptospira santarosai str. 200403458]EMO99475.1 hypothetical protein LEP1GSC120_2613 [Leptospira santarosai str. 200702252]